MRVVTTKLAKGRYFRFANLAKWTSSLILAFQLPGCAVMQSQQPSWPDPNALSEAINSAYSGANMEAMVAKYGVPQRSIKAPDGGDMYAWTVSHTEYFQTLPPETFACTLNATTKSDGTVIHAWLNGQAGACWKFR